MRSNNKHLNQEEFFVILQKKNDKSLTPKRIKRRTPSVIFDKKEQTNKSKSKNLGSFRLFKNN
jgi:hypothetical protein